MERPIAIVAATALLAFAASAHAQREQQPAERGAPPSAAQPSAPVSDADLEKFADIYVDLEQTSDKYQSQIAAAKSEEEARDLQSRMREESTATVAQHGWTPERYVTVADAINADRSLAAKTLELISKRR